LKVFHAVDRLSQFVALRGRLGDAFFRQHARPAQPASLLHRLCCPPPARLCSGTSPRVDVSQLLLGSRKVLLETIDRIAMGLQGVSCSPFFCSSWAALVSTEAIRCPTYFFVAQPVDIIAATPTPIL